MAAKLKPDNQIKKLELKVQEAKNIFTALQLMSLDESYPEKLKAAINSYLNDSKNGNN